MKKLRLLNFVLFFNLLLTHLVSATPAADWHTQSNYTDVISTHIHLDLEVDFQHKQLKGYVEHTIKTLNKQVTLLSLDTRALEIFKVELLKDEPVKAGQLENSNWQLAQFRIGEEDPVRGRQLNIKLAPKTVKVRVYYHTSPQASGIQWLNPEQTAGKKHPFMFSQSQAIHSRSWIPIQDTPAMRVTYSAKITTKQSLRPVMSANNNPKRSADGVYHFEMPQPIPPYLIAIAAGDIHYKKMSNQTAIYAELAYLDAAAKEFEDTQAMIEATEKMYGAYRWNQYDLLILPPSFPFGGMENPRLSFITPTVIAGDKSLVSLIAHELAHSWSGNLVTNATWRDLWLNEGFTSYVENRIMEAVFGRERAVMEQALSKQALNEELKVLDQGDTILHVKMQGRDPDDAFSDVPYTKGQLFLIFLEEKFGREKFDPFVKQYFSDHAFQSITTETFVKYLDKNLISKYPGIVSQKQIDTWIFQPNLPSFAPQPTSEAFVRIQTNIDGWTENNAPLSDIPTGKWTVHEWLYFINNLPQDISLNKMAQLDQTYDLTKSTNNEIAHAWLLLSIKRQYAAVNERLQEYLLSIGRRKLIVPLYEELIKEDTSREFAKRVYSKARPGYHPLAQRTIDDLFKDKK